MPKRTELGKEPERKAKKLLQSEEMKKFFEAIESERERKRNAFRKAVGALSGSSPLLKAEVCLRFWADDLPQWGNLEAVVYFASRGEDCTPFKRTISTLWREA